MRLRKKSSRLIRFWFKNGDRPWIMERNREINARYHTSLSTTVFELFKPWTLF